MQNRIRGLYPAKEKQQKLALVCSVCVVLIVEEVVGFFCVCEVEQSDAVGDRLEDIW